MKKAVSTLLLLVMLLVMLPTAALAENSNYLYLGNDSINLDNQSIFADFTKEYALDEGYAIYSRTLRQLTLVNAKVDSICTNHDLTIKIVGNCTVSGQSAPMPAGIYSEGALKITGSGSLKVNGLVYGIWAGNISISGVSVTAVYNDTDEYIGNSDFIPTAAIFAEESVTISDATVTANGTTNYASYYDYWDDSWYLCMGIYGMDKVTIKNSTVKSYGKGPGVGIGSHVSIAISGSDVTAEGSSGLYCSVGYEERDMSVTISNSTVNATGTTDHGIAIGYSDANAAIIITSSDVTAAGRANTIFANSSQFFEAAIMLQKCYIARPLGSTVSTTNSYAVIGSSGGTVEISTDPADVIPSINLSQYLSTTKNGAATLKNSKYFESSASKADKEAFVANLTNTSLRYADAASYEVINARLYDLLYKAAYRPVIFGGTEEVMKTWPLQNKHYQKVYQYYVEDANLGKIGPWKNAAWGCYSYGRFASYYTYGTNGLVKSFTAGSTGTIQTQFRKSLDPGETIFYVTYDSSIGKDNTHALVYLGESGDGKGFYFISYNGGDNGTNAYHTIRVGYFSWTDFFSVVKNRTVQLWDTNKGSYYAGTAKGVTYSKEAGTVEVNAACPVEVVVSLTGVTETLDSRDIIVDGDTIIAPFGTMTAYGTAAAGDRSVEIELIMVEGEEYSFTFIGTGEGTMDLTFVYTYAEEDDDYQVKEDIRTFLGVPITSGTTITTSGMSVLSTLELYVDDGGGGDIIVWQAGENETVTAATEGYLPYSPYGVNDLDGGEEGQSGGGSGGASNYSLTFETNGGSAIAAVSGAGGSVIDLSAYKPTREGYDFAGWYLDKELTEAVSGVKMTANATVYAKWTKQAAKLPFTDVNESDWFYDSVVSACTLGLFNGTSATAFSPNASMTRAMFATVLARSDGADLSSYTSSRFGDVGSGTWYGPAVEWAAANSIVSGYSGMFDPDAPVTREQMAVMLYNYMKYKGCSIPASGTESFADEADISTWALEAVRVMQTMGIINGKPGNLFDPQGIATRAEVATIFERFAEL